MNLFTESDLRFSFPEDWTVRKFDDTVAYQSLSGRGLKGVDFIAISPDDRLWLIEVKNYRPRYRSGRKFLAKRRNPAALAEQVAGKFQDSIRLINVVDAYLKRSWTRRLVVWYHNTVRANTASNYWFWDRARTLSRGPDSGTAGGLEYVLWLETPERNDDYDHRTYRELLKRMPAGTSITVTERDAGARLPFGVVE